MVMPAHHITGYLLIEAQHAVHGVELHAYEEQARGDV
jgi:hypothetical protein